MTLLYRNRTDPIEVDWGWYESVYRIWGWERLVIAKTYLVRVRSSGGLQRVGFGTTMFVDFGLEVQ